MRRFIPFAIALLLLAPSVAAAQFGPIVPDVCKACPCGFGGVLAIVQNLINFVISLSIIIATIVIAWAGGLYILSPTNPEMRGTANKMLINAVIGIMIVLSAWLIVDFVMKTLYGGQFGPWNSILTDTSGSNSCVQPKPTAPLFSGDIFTVTPGQGSGGSTGGGSGTNCPVPAESTMVAFDSSVVAGGSGKATAVTVKNFMDMRAAALRDGVDLKVSSAYRSDAAQVTLWNQNGCTSGTCRIATAKPCSLGGAGSNHNSGQALDLTIGCSNGNSSCNTKAYQWMKANGGKWNFRNSIQDDPVHWSPGGN
jgi:hypothetical protein